MQKQPISGLRCKLFEGRCSTKMGTDRMAFRGPLWPILVRPDDPLEGWATLMRELPTGRLSSWKAIATYLDCSVRTVRRWERAEGLPVHRHVHQKLGRVFALKTEIDAWRDTRARRPDQISRSASTPPTASVRSIAVLPFNSPKSDAQDDYFAEGLTEEVTSALAKVHALQVTSRRSAAVFRNTSAGARDIAERLGVHYLVEGNVRRVGNRLRVSAQLIDARQDVHRWAGTYDGMIDDVFSIQEQLARKIVDALELRLTAAERTASQRARHRQSARLRILPAGAPRHVALASRLNRPRRTTPATGPCAHRRECPALCRTGSGASSVSRSRHRPERAAPR